MSKHLSATGHKFCSWLNARTHKECSSLRHWASDKEQKRYNCWVRMLKRERESVSEWVYESMEMDVFVDVSVWYTSSNSDMYLDVSCQIQRTPWNSMLHEHCKDERCSKGRLNASVSKKLLTRLAGKKAHVRDRNQTQELRSCVCESCISWAALLGRRLLVVFYSRVWGHACVGVCVCVRVRVCECHCADVFARFRQARFWSCMGGMQEGEKNTP